jgi:hypothetical protein
MARLLHYVAQTGNKMIHSMNKLIAALLVLFCLAACEQEGPAERFGERVDDAADSITDAARDARDEAEDLADDLGDRIDEAQQ